MVFDRWQGFQGKKVKPALSQAIIRIGLVKNKRAAAMRSAKKAVADYLSEGKIEKARIEAERIVQDDFMVEAFDILELMCELVRDNVKALEAEEKCPFDMMEAVCTLLYASTRTEISELSVVKKQFTIKYGKEFVEGALTNRGGVVNERVLHRMSGKRPNAFLVLNYMKEVAHAHNVDWTPDELTAEAGERFDAPMVAPDGSSVLPGTASGLGAAAYQVTDGNIVDTATAIQHDAARLERLNNSIVDQSSAGLNQDHKTPAAPPKAPLEKSPEPMEDELDLDSLTARFEAFKHQRKNESAEATMTTGQANDQTAQNEVEPEFVIPVAPMHQVEPTVEFEKNEATTETTENIQEDKGAVPKYDELLQRFAKLKSGN